ncbi:tRNA dihydrouridine(20/20a) synthase DusA [Methylomonas methanica]|uniref:tRNA-dihydrouridine(20/20a) synthase n=1 Tax=Methylomonas methanica (strain DSM 25384 / MC09) TaxID=857087 RepID=F9ZVN2_METMM|nr:tRNA dihydrouridine(20/20a) synthase DusA [Methylomonas methanica]AEF99510.1 TIM-barrel protein, yjbN family [Methylomonas methanica MC09]
MHNKVNRRFCVAPMLDWTDRHCRYFYRLLSRHAVLYTEMVTTGAILQGNQQRHLQFNPEEQPVALQLGGSHPQDLARCAELAEQYGYDEVNLNIGCPSDRVQNGRFGACLMAEPELVAACVAAMRQAVSIPVTVKSRIGIDERDSYEELTQFIATVAAGGCDTFIVHARKAWLSGLSPKQNRDIPPLCYEMVYRLKHDFPELDIIINGGITSLDASLALLKHVDGVMLGREVYHNPYLLSEVDRCLYGDDYPQKTRQDVILAMLPYVRQQLQHGVRLNNIARHLLGLFHGVEGARAWRRYISENANKPGADEQVLLHALEFTV